MSRLFMHDQVCRQGDVVKAICSRQRQGAKAVSTRQTQGWNY